MPMDRRPSLSKRLQARGLANPPKETTRKLSVGGYDEEDGADAYTDGPDIP